MVRAKRFLPSASISALMSSTWTLVSRSPCLSRAWSSSLIAMSPVPPATSKQVMPPCGFICVVPRSARRSRPGQLSEARLRCPHLLHVVVLPQPVDSQRHGIVHHIVRRRDRREDALDWLPSEIERVSLASRVEVGGRAYRATPLMILARSGSQSGSPGRRRVLEVGAMPRMAAAAAG